MRDCRGKGSRAGADCFAIVSVAAILAASLVLLALVDGQADACRAVSAQLHQHWIYSAPCSTCLDPLLIHNVNK